MPRQADNATAAAGGNDNSDDNDCDNRDFGPRNDAAAAADSPASAAQPTTKEATPPQQRADGDAVTSSRAPRPQTQPEPLHLTTFEDNFISVVELSFLGDDGTVHFMDLLLKRRRYFKDLPDMLRARQITEGFLDLLQVGKSRIHFSCRWTSVFECGKTTSCRRFSTFVDLHARSCIAHVQEKFQAGYNSMDAQTLRSGKRFPPHAWVFQIQWWSVGIAP